jgi:hypothetical protein
MAKSKIRAVEEESPRNRDFDALQTMRESTTEEIHALVENEKNDFITFEEYAKRRGIKL